ncbi:hypothetical protein N9X00_07060, partial [Gammaproteobacteria bacterium]|nr:hypothetical protein [Gammaproteobacteria bacterium]
MVEHDMNIVFDIADRISVLVYGEIIATDKRYKGNRENEHFICDEIKRMYAHKSAKAKIDGMAK